MPFDFVIAARGILGNAVLQHLFNGCTRTFVPDYYEVDRQDGADGLLALAPGAATGQPWPWVGKTGLLLHGPVWWPNAADVLGRVTTGALLVQMVREPRAHILSQFRVAVRVTCTELVLSGADEAERKRRLGELADLDRFLDRFAYICRYEDAVAPIRPLFRQVLALDLAETLPERLPSFIARLFDAIGIGYDGDPAPLRRKLQTPVVHYLSHSGMVIDLLGHQLPVLMFPCADPDEGPRRQFSHELARVDASVLLAGRTTTLEFEDRPIGLFTPLGSYAGVPPALRRAATRRRIFEQHLQQGMFPQWLARAEEMEAMARVLIDGVDVARLQSGLMARIADDLPRFLAREPRLREKWGL
jgi:hypothetical protein